MAINVSFNGATIFKPGSYSKTNIDLGGGFPLGPAGLIAVIGEADAGAPGAQEINIAQNRFTADQLVQVRNKYRSGQIADSAAMLFAPAADAAIPSGAQTVWYYKTNNSTRANLVALTGYGTVQSLEWGIGGNRISYKSVLVGETAPTYTSGEFDEHNLTTESFSYTLNGATTNVFTCSNAPIDNTDMAAQIANAANWSAGAPAGITVTVGGSDSASTIIFTMAAAPTQHSLGWGRALEVGGANPALFEITPSLVGAAVEPSVELTLDQKRDNIQETDQLGGNIVLSIGRTNSAATAATVSITDTSIILSKNGAIVEHTYVKASYSTILDIVTEINLTSDWSASISNVIYNQLSPDALDQVTTVGAFSVIGNKPARIKKDAAEVADFFDLSSLTSIENQVAKGLPDAAAETTLTGGTRGVTTSASIVAALEKFEKFHVNSVVPLFSRDAAADAADGLTASGSTYTIAGIHQAVKTHISLMKTTKRRSERQGYLSIKSGYTDSAEQASILADGRIQLAIQDIRQTDVQGSIRWFQPWALACQLAGARGGAPIGEPLTFKFLNLAGIRHTAQDMSTPDANIVNDFDPDLQADQAIQAGITFLEAPQTGGFRVVVDNTTYGRDGNFVFNRANVLYAADIVAFNFRNTLENVFIGRKNTVSTADVAGVASSTLTTFLAQGVIVSTPDAPLGFKNLVVRIVGNTIYVEVIIKLVEGIDFILSEITIQRAAS